MMPDGRVQELERLVRSNARWTTALLVLLVVLVVSAAGFAVIEASNRLEPERVVDEGENFIKAQYPHWRDEVTKEVATAAPTVAKGLTRRVEQSMPSSRQKLESFLIRASVGVDLGRTEAMGEQQFRDFVQSHRAELTRAFEELRKTPGKAPQAAALLEASLEKLLADTLRKDAEAAMTELDRLNTKLDRLEKDDGLSNLERVERRMVETVRALQTAGVKSDGK